MKSKKEERLKNKIEIKIVRRGKSGLSEWSGLSCLGYVNTMETGKILKRVFEGRCVVTREENQERDGCVTYSEVE